VAERIPARLSRAEGRRFGLTVGVAFLVLAGFLWWRGRPMTSAVFFSLGAILTTLGLIAPGALRPVRRVWMGAAVAMSKVTTPVFLGIVYFGVITPIGMVRRLFGRNPLKHRAGDGSSWLPRERRGHQQTDMEHQF
jgi:saxitoxin biosynthesis operon SxtJ-like protein